MTIEIANITTYYALKDDGNATISADGSETKTISYKRYCQDSGVELDDPVRVLFTLDELTALKIDYENKIVLVNQMIDEIKNKA